MGLHSLQKAELFPVSVETLYQLEFSRKTGPRRCVYIHMYIDKENEEDYMYINLSVYHLSQKEREITELAIVGVGKSKICRAG